MKDFNELHAAAEKLGKVTVSVAVAQDKEVLEAVLTASRKGLIDAVLVGDETMIRKIMDEIGMEDVPVINEPDEEAAALKAVELVHDGKAHVLMKGLVNTSVFMKAVLNKEKGLRTGKILSHLAVFEIPGEKKLLFKTDGGMNIAPDLNDKKEILASSIEAVKKLGISEPKVAALAANEKVSESMPVTIDCAALVEMEKRGEIPHCIIKGPIAMDVALNKEAAKHKGIESKISGDVDIILVPEIETGNVIGKMLVYYAKAKIAGVILGASNPIIMVSRADTAEAKVNSIILAGLLATR